MTSKRGEVPQYLIYLILGLVVLVVVSLFLIGKPIPQGYKDAQAFEKNLREQWDILWGKKRVEQLQTQDAAFLKLSTAFLQQYRSCLQSPTSDCLCKIDLPKDFPQGYRLVFAHDARRGYYAYPTTANGKTPLRDIIVLTSSMDGQAQGYCFVTRYENRHNYYSMFELFLNDAQRLVFLSPDDRSPPTFSLGDFVFFYKPTARALCLIEPYYGFVIWGDYSSKKQCELPSS